MNRFLPLALLATLLLFAAGVRPATARVIGKQVEYTAQGVTLRGYLAYDDRLKGIAPAVLVVHEWWGLNDFARKRARMVAELGYTALAVDMYGDGQQASHPEEAAKFSAAVMHDFPTAKARFLAAEEFLRRQPTVDPDRIAAIGYCFGGGVVLNLARQGSDLKGVASFHGMLAPLQPATMGTTQGKILVLHGDDDRFTTPEQIAAFRQEMSSAQVDYQFISYPDAQHGFTNPGASKLGKKFNLPLAYNKKADKESWQTLKKFLTDIFHPYR